MTTSATHKQCVDLMSVYDVVLYRPEPEPVLVLHRLIQQRRLKMNKLERKAALDLQHQQQGKLQQAQNPEPFEPAQQALRPPQGGNGSVCSETIPKSEPLAFVYDGLRPHSAATMRISISSLGLHTGPWSPFSTAISATSLSSPCIVDAAGRWTAETSAAQTRGVPVDILISSVSNEGSGLSLPLMGSDTSFIDEYKMPSPRHKVGLQDFDRAHLPLPAAPHHDAPHQDNAAAIVKHNGDAAAIGRGFKGEGTPDVPQPQPDACPSTPASVSAPQGSSTPGGSLEEAGQQADRQPVLARAFRAILSCYCS